MSTKYIILAIFLALGYVASWMFYAACAGYLDYIIHASSTGQTGKAFYIVMIVCAVFLLIGLVGLVSTCAPRQTIMVSDTVFLFIAAAIHGFVIYVYLCQGEKLTDKILEAVQDPSLKGTDVYLELQLNCSLSEGTCREPLLAKFGKLNPWGFLLIALAVFTLIGAFCAIAIVSLFKSKTRVEGYDEDDNDDTDDEYTSESTTPKTKRGLRRKASNQKKTRSRK